MEYFNYYVIFKDDAIANYMPILKLSRTENISKYSNNTMHLLDDNLNGTLSIIEYIMHLPRATCDLFDIDEHFMGASHDTSHIILPIPESELKYLTITPLKPTIIFLADECSDFVEEECKKYSPAIGVYKATELTKDLLNFIWNKLQKECTLQEFRPIVHINSHFILKDECLKALPLLYLDRQFDQLDHTLSKIYNSQDIEKDCIQMQLKNKTKLNTLISMSNSGITIENINFSEIYKKTYKLEYSKFDVSVVITFPGVSKKQIDFGMSAKVLSSQEKRMIRALGIHRAIARSGVIIEFPNISEKLFQKYAELEERCKNGTNNKYIWKTLQDIGILLTAHLTESQVKVLQWAKDITVFSDFPIGLAIFDGAEVPLQCYKQISYRPLTPLTRQIQNELPKINQHYLGKQCTIAMAECILNDRENQFVYPMCELVHKTLANASNEYDGVSMVYEQTYTVQSLLKFIKDNQRADILYISAHGHYDKRANMAGIMVGDEFWMADDNIKVPPIVILSACHTSPRGIGVVNIADLFIRNGAITVLSTFIPVNAHRNLILMTRLFTYIFEAQAGSNQYKTLSEAWSGVVASNAIHELMLTSKKFRNWMYSENPNKKIRAVEFQLERCVGRLRNTHIYSDTIAIIKEMLIEENMEGKFGDILDAQNFFPESFFYQLIGSPENIFLYNEIFKEVVYKC